MPNIPKPDRRLFLIEIMSITALLLLIWLNSGLLSRIRGLENGIEEMQKTSQRLSTMKREIGRFMELERTYLPCADREHPFGWEDIDLDFNAISFRELLSRLFFLNEAIGRKYHKKGIFILTDFYTVNAKRDLSSESNSTRARGEMHQRPSFKIKGRLLCACQ